MFKYSVMKAVSEITAGQTWTSFAKFIKLCSIEYVKVGIGNTNSICVDK